MSGFKIVSFNHSSDGGPDNFAPVVFLENCNLHCPYCMNAELVNKKDNIEISEKQILDKIRFSVDEEWFGISGGEPTCSDINKLIDFIRQLKQRKYKVYISTNGTKPDMLRKLLEEIQYVCIDLKSTHVEDYESIGAGKDGLSKVLESISLIRKLNLLYEIRTTLYPPFFRHVSSFKNILRKEDKWVLQQFRHVKNMLNKKCHYVEPYDDEMVRDIVYEAQTFIDNVVLRCV